MRLNRIEETDFRRHCVYGNGSPDYKNFDWSLDWYHSSRDSSWIEYGGYVYDIDEMDEDAFSLLASHVKLSDLVQVKPDHLAYDGGSATFTIHNLSYSNNMYWVVCDTEGCEQKQGHLLPQSRAIVTVSSGLAVDLYVALTNDEDDDSMWDTDCDPFSLVHTIELQSESSFDRGSQPRYTTTAVERECRYLLLRPWVKVTNRNEKSALERVRSARIGVLENKNSKVYQCLMEAVVHAAESSGLDNLLDVQLAPFVLTELLERFKDWPKYYREVQIVYVYLMEAFLRQRTWDCWTVALDSGAISEFAEFFGADTHIVKYLCSIDSELSELFRLFRLALRHSHGLSICKLLSMCMTAPGFHAGLCELLNKIRYSLAGDNSWDPDPFVRAAIADFLESLDGFFARIADVVRSAAFENCLITMFNDFEKSGQSIDRELKLMSSGPLRVLAAEVWRTKTFRSYIAESMRSQIKLDDPLRVGGLIGTLAQEERVVRALSLVLQHDDSRAELIRFANDELRLKDLSGPGPTMLRAILSDSGSKLSAAVLDVAQTASGFANWFLKPILRCATEQTNSTQFLDDSVEDADKDLVYRKLLATHAAAVHNIAVNDAERKKKLADETLRTAIAARENHRAQLEKEINIGIAELQSAKDQSREFRTRIMKSGLDELTEIETYELVDMLGIVSVAPIMFLEQNISGDVLPELSEEDYQDIFKVRRLGDRRRLTLAIQQLAEGNGFPEKGLSCPRAWSINDVCTWLVDEGHGDMCGVFSDEAIDGACLLTLDKTDLESLGFRTVGKRAKLQSSLQKLKKQTLTHEASAEGQHPMDAEFVLNAVLDQDESLKARLKQSQNAPPEFLCPILHDVMEDPVLAMDSHTYERGAIEAWFKADASHRSPMTNLPLETTLVSNLSLRQMIERHKRQHIADES